MRRADELGALRLGEFFVPCPSEVGVSTTHDDEGAMVREAARQFGLKTAPLRTFDASHPFRSPFAAQKTIRTVPAASMTAPRLEQALLVRTRGASREHRPRQTRRTSRVGSRGDPPRSDDDEDDVDVLSGVAA